jgi:uncharacterized PurR-regulated membrane protein YhhQ (DUF165 family)
MLTPLGKLRLRLR